MMIESPVPYIDSESFDRGLARYKKDLARSINLQKLGYFTVILGGVLIVVGVSNIFNAVLMTLIILFGLLLQIIGGSVWVITARLSKRRDYKNFDYRLAVHYMREMNVKNPEKILEENPKFLQAFYEVREAVTARQAKSGGVKLKDQVVTRLAYRIASLMLRDSTSLALKSYTISLINDGTALDYETFVHQLELVRYP